MLVRYLDRLAMPCDMLVICNLQVPTTTATVQMKDGQLIPAGVFEGVVDPSRVGPNGAEFSGNNHLVVTLHVFVYVVCTQCIEMLMCSSL